MSAQPVRDPYGRPTVAPREVAPAPVAPRPSYFGLATRIILTLAGAAGMIIGGFMNWTNGMAGVDMSDRAFYQTAFVHEGNFLATVGFASIALGLVALLGMALRSGWLTRLAGALGIVAFVLFTIQLARADASLPGAIDMGAWLCLGGGIVALIGGFFGTRTVVATTAPALVE
jgi:hypothetical protein